MCAGIIALFQQKKITSHAAKLASQLLKCGLDLSA
jgi:hypothetical protein